METTLRHYTDNARIRTRTELKTTCVCYYSHPNELEALSCKECYPFEKEEEDEWKEQESEFDIAPYLLTQT